MANEEKTPLFVMLRHGRTAANDQKLYRSWSNASEAQLDDGGRDDAREAARWLSKANMPISTILCDSLDRTLETAEIVAGVLGVDQVAPLRRLHPLNMGDWTLTPKDEHPVDDFIKNSSQVIPGGESLDAFNARQMETFEDIFKLADSLGAGQLLVVGHGSNVSFLHNHVFNTGDAQVGYEGLVDPGGLVAATTGGLVPLTKIRGKKKDIDAGSVGALAPWAVLYVEGHDQPYSCMNCHMLYEKQQTCAIHGPKIIIREIHRGGEEFYPVCGLQDFGKPMMVDHPMYPAVDDPDLTGLEWVRGKGTNCGGVDGGRGCSAHYLRTGPNAGFCGVLQSEVPSSSCCAANESTDEMESIDWREAQSILNRKN